MELSKASELVYLIMMRVMLCVPLGVSLVVLYMQLVRVYKGFLVFYSKLACWASD
jgi:hypothetical protein